jgi:uncharacterized circularly permuted ATP-grasp superfamily protein
VSGIAFDEAYGAEGRPRPQYAELLTRIREPGEVASEVRRRLRTRGVTFPPAPGGIFALDPVPRVLTADESAALREGIAQRLRALEAFLVDLYGEQRMLREGVVPRRAVEGSPHYEPDMRGAPVRRWISFGGMDVVRGPDGRFRVIEDQVRMPSGLAYAVAARDTLGDVMPVPPPQTDLSAAYEELATALREAAPADEPRMVLLCEGERAAAWWEHALMARELGAPAVRLADLERRGDRLVAWIDGRPQQVDVVYQRTEEDRFTDPDGRRTALGEALLEPCRAGTLACVNAPGSGVADDKVVHAHVDELVRALLGEEPLLESVPSFDLGEEDERRTALDRLDELVVKPRGEMGGDDVVLWRHAGEDVRRETLAAIEERPEGWVAQELVTLSVHPTVCAGRLEPRHVDLRPYVIASSRGIRVAAALSRVALERGSMLVNSGQGGGAKDTWLPG